MKHEFYALIHSPILFYYSHHKYIRDLIFRSKALLNSACLRHIKRFYSLLNKIHMLLMLQKNPKKK